ncbi:MAG: mitochondrial peripheral inner membrane protein [Peltula sp. TS41687]|nr:MAG: mitochondrial peripheral inner membrane protein [Peltula sp. TS41687]
MTIRLLVRHEPLGEVSSYLHSLRPGDGLELRGPKIEYEFPPSPPDDDDDDEGVEVVFIAGGTGIAPALQVCDWVLRQGGTGSGGRGEEEEDERSGKGKRKGKVRVRILWACRSRADCLGGVDGRGDWVTQQQEEEEEEEEEEEMNKKKKKEKDEQVKPWRSLLWKQIPTAGEEEEEEEEANAKPPSPNSTMPSADTVAAAAAADTQIEQSPIAHHLTTLQTLYPDRIRVEYFVDAEARYITRDDLVRCLNLRDTTTRTTMTTREKSGAELLKRKIIFVAGPDGFVSALAGPKGLEAGTGIGDGFGGKGQGQVQGQGQGPLGGLLAGVLVGGGGQETGGGEEERGDWAVWKL